MTGNVVIQPYFGDSTVAPMNVSAGSSNPHTINSFALMYDFNYDPVVQAIIQPYGPQCPQGVIISPVATQTDIQIVLVANASDVTSSIDLTSFKIYTI